MANYRPFRNRNLRPIPKQPVAPIQWLKLLQILGHIARFLYYLSQLL